LHPFPVLLPIGGRGVWKKAEGFEIRTDGFHNPVNPDLAELSWLHASVSSGQEISGYPQPESADHRIVAYPAPLGRVIMRRIVADLDSQYHPDIDLLIAGSCYSVCCIRSLYPPDPA
jgi:hypothetical protein